MALELVNGDCHFWTWSAMVGVRRGDIQAIHLSLVQDGARRLDEG